MLQENYFSLQKELKSVNEENETIELEKEEKSKTSFITLNPKKKPERKIESEKNIVTDVIKNDDKIQIYFHDSNLGKGAAIHTALKYIAGDIVIIQDADLEYDPEEISALIEPIVKGLADVVYGSRFRIRKTGRVMYFYHYLANVMLTFISNLFTNLNMTDMETGYKVFKSSVFLKNQWLFVNFMKLSSQGPATDNDKFSIERLFLEI